VTIKDDLLALDGNSATQKAVLLQAIRHLQRAAGPDNKAIRRYANSLKAQANTLHNEAWFLVWSIPQVITSCADAVEGLCFTSSHAPAIEDFNAKSRLFVELTKQVVKRGKKFSGFSAKFAKSIVKIAERELAESLQISAQVPTSTTSCAS